MTKASMDPVDLMNEIQRLAEKSTSREVVVLANAILWLSGQSTRQHQSNRSAFEQIEELGRRQSDDAEASRPRRTRKRRKLK